MPSATMHAESRLGRLLHRLRGQGDRSWTLLLATAVFALGALAWVWQMPTAVGLVLSQGFGSVLALAVMAWAVRRDWRP